MERLLENLTSFWVLSCVAGALFAHFGARNVDVERAMRIVFFAVPALLLAGLILVPVGAVVAIPAIRLSGLFLALATFGFPEGALRRVAWGGLIATEITARANPDGYTLLMASTAFTMNPAVIKKLLYNNLFADEYGPLERVAA